MTTPILTPDVYRDGPGGDTPLDAAGMNRIWAALMQALLDQLVPRQVAADNSANMRDMMLVDASNGPVVLQAPQAIALGQWGARKIDSSANPVTIVPVGADVLDEHGRTSWTLASPDDDVIFSFASPGRYVLWRSRTAALPATRTRLGPIKLAGDLGGTADAPTVPGKENTGVAAGLLSGHISATDPHGDRAAAAANTLNAINAHAQAVDPHGDRSWGQTQFVPLSWFDQNGQLLPSHTGQISIINTFPVNSQAAQLALTAQTGDVAVRTDQGKSYILQGSDPSVFSNWTELPSIGRVNSVNDQQGSVRLGASDVGAASATDPRVVNSEVTTNKGIAGGYVGLDTSGGVPRVNIYQATTALPGSVQLAGDLGGTALAPTVPGLTLRAPTPILDTTVYTSARVPPTGRISLYNAGAASFTNVLPAAPTGTNPPVVLEVKNMTPVNSTNTVTFTPAGTDTIDSGSAVSIVLRTFHESKRLIGYAGNWTVDASNLSVVSLDNRYLQLANAHPVPAGGAAGYALVKNTGTDYDYGWGAVGAAQNVQQDLKIVSVRNYGAVGDGTTDDAAKIQQALGNTPAGGTCYLPPGVYAISSPIVVPPQVTLEGAHTETLTYLNAQNVQVSTPIATSLKVLPGFAGGPAAVRIVDKQTGGYAYSAVGAKVRRITIDGTSAPAGIKGVQVFGFVREVTLEYVTVRKTTDGGFDFAVNNAATDGGTAPQSNRALHCVADNCGGAGFSVSNMPDSTFIDCNAQGSGWIGFYLAGFMNGQLTNCRSEWSGQYGFWIGSGYWGTGKGSGGMAMFGCMSDRNNYDGIYVEAKGNGQIMIMGHQARRDGRNNNAGGGNYAGIQVNGATMPVLVDGLIVYPGVNDDAADTVTGNSPQFGVRATNASYLAVGGAGYIHAVQAPFSDAGGNTAFYRSGVYGTATGTTDAPVRSAPLPTLVPSPPVDQPFAAAITPNAAAGNYRTTTATAAFTLNPPTNPADGQLWRYRWIASGAQYVMTLGTGWRKPASLATTLTVPAGRRGDLMAVYDAAEAAWTVLSMQAQQAGTT